MKTNTITQVSKSLGISTRMLRYYEQVGLISSYKKDDYAYRMYDENMVERLKQILLLRKLRISVKQIKIILLNENALETIKIFQQNISELNEELTALSTIKEILLQFIVEISETTHLPLLQLIENNEGLMNTIDSLSIITINFKEDQMMKNLKKVNDNQKFNDVRILYLPPSTVAAAHHIGDDPETHSNNLIDQFVRETKLSEIKPDLRHYGFNHPNPVDETGYHGYETLVTIPPDFDVPAPLMKKEFKGGSYATHMIHFGNFNEWEGLAEWVNNNDKYEFAGDWSDQEHMCGLLDEHLNYYSHIHLENTEPENMQLDLLIPIREK
ncbi:MAG: effector binding domain-containing protein [Anaerorhabdus sp.]|uniref:effector binding domain-containing protein n=1 Tax=Anaerorhabdus sp. TaxID=1872524 RepID=UPI003A85E60B